MLNVMTVGSQQAVITFDSGIDVFRGECIGLNSGADCCAPDVTGLRREGKLSRAAFLGECAKRRMEPRNRVSRTFVLQDAPEVHAAAATAAAARGQRLSQWVTVVIPKGADASCCQSGHHRLPAQPHMTRYTLN